MNISHRRDLDAEKVTRGERSIVGALLGNGAGVFAPNIKLGAFGPAASWDFGEQWT